MIQNVGELTQLPDMLFDGYVTARRHSSAPLTIYNYTAKAQYENMWNETTLTCRGLIADGGGQIVARPFRKFFNLEQVEHLPAEPYEVFEKLDGSLGVMYWVQGVPFIATRGSFDGEQAKEANRMLGDYALAWKNLDPAYTYLFEIVYPENRIVVNYGDERRLVMLAAIHTETGREMDYRDLYWPHIARAFTGDINAARNAKIDNAEGFVIRFTSGFRVKVKLAEYVRLHKLLTGINERTIWRDYLMPGMSLDSLLERAPDEFNAWIKATVESMRNQYAVIDMSAQSVYRHINENVAPSGNRREFANAAKSSPYAPILFNMLDGKDYSRHIWKMIEPKSTHAFRCDNDA